MAGNMYDYLDWRGDLTFSQSAFNVIDSLILSALCSFKYRGSYDEEAVNYEVALRDGMAEFEEIRDPAGFFPNIVKLSGEVRNYRRFKRLKVFHHVDRFCKDEEKQFSATTYLLSDGSAFVAFRGTDWSMTGWKEDFNMAFSDDIPSHHEAEEYINYVAERLDCPLRISGHSKGGHLAVWAAAHLKEEYQERLLHVYNHDGPGFSKEFIESPGFLRVRDRIYSFVPKSSVVGVLMNYLEYVPISSSAIPVLQHDPFTWLIMGRHFQYDDERTWIGKKMEKYTTSLYEYSANSDMKKYLDEVFGVLKKIGK